MFKPVSGLFGLFEECYTSLYFLAKYPQIQEQLYQEIHQTVGNKDILEKEIAFLQVVLRLRNPEFGPVIIVVKQDKQIHQTKLANQFNYKRWIDQKEVKKNNGYIHIPFAARPKNCMDNIWR